MATDFDETRMLLGSKGGEERRKLLGELFTKHRARLRTMVAMRLDGRLRGRVDPSDVLQDAFLESSRRIDEYLERPEAPLFVWLYFLTAQALQTVHRRHLGARARDARREVSLHGGAVPQATSEALAARLLGQEPSPGEAVLRAERKSLLEQALNEIDPADREIVVLRSFEQLSNSEAARVLEIGEAAAKKRYLRALKRLKEALARTLGGG